VSMVIGVALLNMVGAPGRLATWLIECTELRQHGATG
jgi:hypothetical protein